MSTPSPCRPRRDAGHVYHLFPVRSAARDAMQAHLKARGVETLIHYPVPIPRQPALAVGTPRPTARSPTRVCAEVFSLPLYPASTRGDRRSRTRRGRRSPSAVMTARSADDAPLAPGALRCVFADHRRAVRRLREPRCACGALRGGAGVPGPLRCPMPSVGYRLQAERARPLHDRRVRHRDRASTPQGVRDDERSARSRRTSGASSCSATRWCCRCRCRSARRSASCSKRRSTRADRPIHYRVINAGVQGYGPVEELLFFRSIAARVPAGPRDRDALRRQRRRGSGALGAAPARRRRGRPTERRRRVADHAAAADRAPQHGAAGAAAARGVRRPTASRGTLARARAAASELRRAPGAADRRGPAHLASTCVARDRRRGRRGRRADG